MADRGTHTLRISLFEEPSIYREIEIGSAKSLWNLAEAIVQAFDFDFDHAFGFYSGRTEGTLMQAKPKFELFADMGGQSDAGSVKKTRIAEAFPRIGHKMIFLFDYGDEWLFSVEMIGAGQLTPKSRYPKILKVVGTAPEQYPTYDEEED